jgi:hypothetical protein
MCSKGNGKQESLGLYATPTEAHYAWKKYKLALAKERKNAMDEIDIRIYPNVVTIINSHDDGSKTMALNCGVQNHGA